MTRFNLPSHLGNQVLMAQIQMSTIHNCPGSVRHCLLAVVCPCLLSVGAILGPSADWTFQHSSNSCRNLLVGCIVVLMFSQISLPALSLSAFAFVPVSSVLSDKNFNLPSTENGDGPWMGSNLSVFLYPVVLFYFVYFGTLLILFTIKKIPLLMAVLL